jgi:hypothetical protein
MKYTKHKVVGVGKEWTGWYGRFTEYSLFLKNIHPDTFVLITDARDVVINENYSKFIKKALREYSKKPGTVICGTEQNCCTKDPNNSLRSSKISNDITDHIQEYKRFMELKAGNNYYKYIQFGLLFGKANDFLKLFSIMDLKPGDDDQTMLYKLFYEDDTILNLDYSGILFSNAPSLDNESDTCYYDWNYWNNAFRNTITNNIPSLIQTPGSYWSCYDMLLSKLL